MALRSMFGASEARLGMARRVVNSLTISRSCALRQARAFASTPAGSGDAAWRVAVARSARRTGARFMRGSIGVPAEPQRLLHQPASRKAPAEFAPDAGRCLRRGEEARP